MLSFFYMNILDQDAEFSQNNSDQEDEESIGTANTNYSYHTETTREEFPDEVDEFPDTGNEHFRLDLQEIEERSNKVKIKDLESQETDSSDHELFFKNRIYLEYIGSDNESVGSEQPNNYIESSIPEREDTNDFRNHYLEFNRSDNESIDSEPSDSVIETSSIPESENTDPDNLKSLVESYKTPKFPHCNVCNIVFRTLEQLNEHSTTHNSKKIVICEVCKNIIHKDVYKVHLKVHRELYNKRLAKKYQKSECSVCGKYVGKNYMKIHLLQHGTKEEKAKRFKKCTICNAHVCVSYLMDHMKRVHMQHNETKAEKTIPKIKCPVCCKMYKKSTFQRHVASHASTPKKYVCEECGREFFSKSTFSTHVLIHKDEFRYKCQFCPYRGKHLGLLKVHVRTHTKDYSYKCETCGSSFITKSNLTAHQKIHSPRVTFICSQCGKQFSRERSLQSHVVSVHEGIKAFACDVCGKKYGNKFVMNAHKKRVHNIAGPSRVGLTPSYLLAQRNGHD